jgi:hypothetical protein
VPRGSSVTFSGQLTPGFATSLSIYYRTSASSAWKKVASSISTNAAGAFSKTATIPLSTSPASLELVVVWFDSPTNRYAASNVAKLTST